MDIEKLDQVLEALLLVSGESIAIPDIVNLLELQNSEVNQSIARLKKKYSGKCGIHLIKYNNKIQFGSNPDYADTLASILNPIREKALSSAALETVAIVAYKQPVTRLEIEQIRGVNSDYAVQVLLNHNLIEVVGRKDVVGKPLLFGTTDAFLKRFQVESIEELPDYEQLLASIKLLEEGNAAPTQGVSLYNEFKLPDDEEPPVDELGEEETPDFLENEPDLQRINLSDAPENADKPESDGSDE